MTKTANDKAKWKLSALVDCYARQEGIDEDDRKKILEHIDEVVGDVLLDDPTDQFIISVLEMCKDSIKNSTTVETLVLDFTDEELEKLHETP